MPHLKIIVNCGPCEAFIGKCVGSLQAQTYTNWQAVVTIDPCEDRSFERAVEATRGDARFTIIHNLVRRYPLANAISAIGHSAARPEDVIVSIDGDDWLNLEDALETIAATYLRHDCWMTYGSWVTNESAPEGDSSGLWPAYADGTTDFRSARWLATQIRTFKKWLWDRLNDQDLRDECGQYFRVAGDLAVMLPLLEMCGTSRARHIAAPLMVYNRAYAQRTSTERFAEQQANDRMIRGGSSYPLIPCGPESQR